MHSKKSVLVIHKFWRLFANTLIVDEKLYLLNKDNLTQPIKMELYQEQKIFSEFLFAFLKSIINFKHLQKKDDPHSCCISRNPGSKIYGQIKAVFWRTFTQTTWQMGWNTVAIWMAAPLQYLLNTLKVGTLEKVFFSNTHNPKTVC